MSTGVAIMGGDVKSKDFRKDDISKDFVTVLDDGTIRRDIAKTLRSDVGREKWNAFFLPSSTRKKK